MPKLEQKGMRRWREVFGRGRSLAAWCMAWPAFRSGTPTEIEAIFEVLSIHRTR